jgi:anti-anti-sigma factor
MAVAMHDHDLAASGDDILDLQILEEPDGVRIVCRGTLDYPDAAELPEVVEACLDGGATAIVLDSRGVGFVGSYGLKATLDALELAARRGATFDVALSPEYERLLELVDVGLVTMDEDERRFRLSLPAQGWRVSGG